jgi:hypothetical protein
MRVLRGEDGTDEGGRDAGERHRPPVDRVAPALRAEARLARADERGRGGVAPAEKEDGGERDEDEKEIKAEEEEEEKRENT